jgi:molybdopterin synthase catalytic subunit
MTIRPIQPHEHERWIELRRALWPDEPIEQIRAEARDYFGPAGGVIDGLAAEVIVAQADDGKLVGFVEVSLRPYARGCVSSPVGYLEGWYVEPDRRRRGIGRALVQAAERWAREKGSVEFASDRDNWNLLSHQAHVALEYKPADRNVYFSKPLAEKVTPATDFIAVTTLDLDAGTITDLVTDGAAGGVAVFLGTTRAERHADGRELVALDYEAYTDMATAQLRQLAADARRRWPIAKLAIVHHVGRVEIGRPSVIIAVSSPHRAEAFDACRWLIDTLKKDVAIWKKEVWADGSGTWVHPT